MHLTPLELGLLVVVAYAVGLSTALVIGHYAAKMTLRMTGQSERVLQEPKSVAVQSGRPVEPAPVPSPPAKLPTQAGKAKT